MRGPVVPVRILVESEWGCDPFFIDRGEGRASYSHIDPEFVQEMFDIPADVTLEYGAEGSIRREFY